LYFKKQFNLETQKHIKLEDEIINAERENLERVKDHNYFSRSLMPSSSFSFDIKKEMSINGKKKSIKNIQIFNKEKIIKQSLINERQENEVYVKKLNVWDEKNYIYSGINIKEPKSLSPTKKKKSSILSLKEEKNSSESPIIVHRKNGVLNRLNREGMIKDNSPVSNKKEELENINYKEELKKKIGKIQRSHKISLLSEFMDNDKEEATMFLQTVGIARKKFGLIITQEMSEKVYNKALLATFGIRLGGISFEEVCMLGYYNNLINHKQKIEKAHRKELMELIEQKFELNKLIDELIKQNNKEKTSYSRRLEAIKIKKKETEFKLKSALESYTELNKEFERKQAKQKSVSNFAFHLNSKKVELSLLEKTKQKIIKEEDEIIVNFEKRIDEITEHMFILQRELNKTKKHISNLTYSQILYYTDMLNKGFDVRKEGLVWIVKRLIELKSRPTYNQFPQHLNNHQIEYLLNLGYKELEYTQLKIVLKGLKFRQQKINEKVKDAFDVTNYKEKDVNIISRFNNSQRKLSEIPIEVAKRKESEAETKLISNSRISKLNSRQELGLGKKNFNIEDYLKDDFGLIEKAKEKENERIENEIRQRTILSNRNLTDSDKKILKPRVSFKEIKELNEEKFVLHPAVIKTDNKRHSIQIENKKLNNIEIILENADIESSSSHKKSFKKSSKRIFKQQTFHSQIKNNSKLDSKLIKPNKELNADKSTFDVNRREQSLFIPDKENESKIFSIENNSNVKINSIDEDNEVKEKLKIDKKSSIISNNLGFSNTNYKLEVKEERKVNKNPSNIKLMSSNNSVFSNIKKENNSKNIDKESLYKSMEKSQKSINISQNTKIKSHKERLKRFLFDNDSDNEDYFINEDFFQDQEGDTNMNLKKHISTTAKGKTKIELLKEMVNKRESNTFEKEYYKKSQIKLNELNKIDEADYFTQREYYEKENLMIGIAADNIKKKMLTFANENGVFEIDVTNDLRLDNYIQNNKKSQEYFDEIIHYKKKLERLQNEIIKLKNDEFNSLRAKTEIIVKNNNFLKIIEADLIYASLFGIS